MKRFFLSVFLGLAVASAGVAQPVGQVSPPPAGPLGVYAAMGSGVGTSLGLVEAGWTNAQFEAFVAGLRAAHARAPYPADDAARQLLQETQRHAAQVRARSQARAGETAEMKEFLRNARASGAMQETESGLLVRLVVPGGGPRPRPQDTIVANFSAKLPDGATEIPSLSGQGIQIKLADLPDGVIEGVQMLGLGGHAIFVLPPWLSFGSGEWPPGLERGTPILLQVELKDIIPNS